MFKRSRRSLNRSLLGMLPDPIRLNLIRRHAFVNPAWPSSSLEIKIAHTAEELQSAYRLLHNSYVDAGFMDPHPTGMRVLPQHLLPQTTTIVAKWDGQVMGTLSLIRDNPFGLPLEKIFDVSSRRKGGRRIAEVSSLAVDPQFRKKASVALFPLFRFVYQYARHFFGTHEFVIAVNPTMVDLYLSLMCFERLEKSTKSYDFVKGAAAVGLYMDFDTCVQKWKEIFGDREETGNFHRYWSQIPDIPQNQLPKRQYLASTDPVISPELLQNFFMEKAQLWKSLTLSDLQILETVYPHRSYQEVFETLRKRYALRPRNGQRIDVQMPAIGSDGLEGEVLNISQSGLQLRSQIPLQQGQTVELQVQLDGKNWTQIHAQVQWASLGVSGLKLLTPNVEWMRMVRTLEHQFDALAGSSEKSRSLAA